MKKNLFPSIVGGHLNRTGRVWALQLLLLSLSTPVLGAGVLLTDDFNRPNGLITNEFAFWNPADPRSIVSPVWAMDSGSFFANGNAGWTGVPNDLAPNATSSTGNNSAVFRLNTKRADFGDVSIEFSLKNQGLNSSRSTPPVAWDGLHIWLRYQSETNLYYASINRRDNTVLIKKKTPGGPSNGGTYYQLSPSVPYAVPYNTWQQIKASVMTNPNGSVTIKLYKDNIVLVSATDNGTIGGPPITGRGRVGIRGDNANLLFDNFIVTDLSPAVPGVPPPPPAVVPLLAPTGVTVTAGDAVATIAWSPVAGATSYNLYRSRTDGVTPSNGYKIANVQSPFLNTGFTNGTPYYMVLTAVNAAGESRASVQVSAIPGSLSLPPAAPSGFELLPGDSQVTARWTPLAGATSYNLYRSRFPGVTKATGFKVSNVTNPTVNTGFVNGTAYYMAVAAVNAAGEGPLSPEKSAVPLPRTPPAPTGVVATSGNGSVTLQWSAVAGATSYNLYRSRSEALTKENAYKIPNAHSPYLNTGFVNGTVYYMFLTAVNASGESPPSAVVSAMPAAGLLAPARLGAAIAGPSPSRVYPNPWRSDRHGGSPVTFDGLATDVTIKIFTMAGGLVTTLPTGSGSVTWDLTNASGEKVGSGVYPYLLTESDGSARRGSLAVVK